jgi:hypothetical protein
MSQRTRTLLLASVFAVVTLAVVADRTGVVDRLRASRSGSSATSYYAAAEALQLEQRLIAQRAEWQAARDSAEQQASAIDRLAHRAPTAQIAAAEIRNRLSETVRGNGEKSLRIEARSPSPIPDDAIAPEVRVIAFDVGFDTDDPRNAFTVIDRLENMPDMYVRITDASLSGGGMKQLANAPIAVSLRVETIAIIEGGS